jgi:hypothetical protein
LVNKRQASTDSHSHHKSVATKDFHPDTKLSTNQTADESVLFSNKVALEKFKKLRASGKLKEEFMDLSELEYNKIERTLEQRAKNEVVMEFDVDEATYHKLMRKLRPDNYKEHVSLCPIMWRLAILQRYFICIRESISPIFFPRHFKPKTSFFCCIFDIFCYCNIVFVGCSLG